MMDTGRGGCRDKSGGLLFIGLLCLVGLGAWQVRTIESSSIAAACAVTAATLAGWAKRASP